MAFYNGYNLISPSKPQESRALAKRGFLLNKNNKESAIESKLKIVPPSEQERPDPALF